MGIFSRKDILTDVYIGREFVYLKFDRQDWDIFKKGDVISPKAANWVKFYVVENTDGPLGYKCFLYNFDKESCVPISIFKMGDQWSAIGVAKDIVSKLPK